MRADVLLRRPLHVFSGRARDVRHISASVDIRLIDDRRVIDDPFTIATANIVPVHVGSRNIPVPHEPPMIMVVSVASSKAQGDRDARSHGSPAVIAIRMSPGHPRRTPFIVRNPHPSIIIVVVPTAVVKGCPAPTIIGYPCPAVVRVDPVTPRRVGGEIRFGIRQPYVSILRVIHPLAIRAQLVIKQLKADPHVLRVHLPREQH
jgi:hypothetical protein